MVAQPEEIGPPFKDYCLILQLHPEADAEMVDAAYWHLAKRYSDARRTDSSAKAKMDDLNEAYSVLRSPTRRDEYLRIRNAVLGEGTLPAPPEPAPEAPPLTVMEKQRPRPPEETAASQPTGGHHSGLARFSVPRWQNALVAVLILTLGSAALVAGAHPAMVAGLLVIAVSLATVPLLRRLPSLPVPSGLPSLRPPAIRIRGPAPKPRTDTTLDADAIRESTQNRRSRLREGNSAEASWTTTAIDTHSEPRPQQDHSDDPTVA